MSVTLRQLVLGDEAVLEAALASTPDTTVFLRSNLARAGLVDDGRPFSGTYVGAFEGARLAGVAAMFWNGNIVVGPGPHAALVAARAAALRGGAVGGILGPHDELVRARAALGLADRHARFSSREILYSLALEHLVVPQALANGTLVVRLPRAHELPELLEWRMRYSAETASMADTPDARQQQAALLDAYQAKEEHFVATVGAEAGEAIVGYSAFNAAVADLVQIGGVWTPPPRRGRGHARCVVAGSLQIARARGVARAVLFTAETNLAAQRSYAAIGFRPVGDYGIVFFDA